MADGALLRRVMVRLRVMAGEAERARRSEGRHGCRSMASIAGQMRVNRWLVRSHDLSGTMAGGAVPVCGMMVVVAAGAIGGLGCGSKRDRRLVTLYTGDFPVRRVSETHLAHPWGVTKDRHLNCDVLRIGKLGFLVAGRALTRSGTLMMADLAPTRRLECQGPSLATKIVAGEAGEASMACVGKGVAGRGGKLGPLPGRILFGRNCPLSPSPSRCD